jgi:hypothetical protein
MAIHLLEIIVSRFSKYLNMIQDTFGIGMNKE